MPKYPLPGHDPIPPQLNPDIDVVTDPQWTYHKHARHRGTRKVVAVPSAAKKVRPPVPYAAPIRCPMEIDMDVAETHINRARSKAPYDPSTGLGDHLGENVKGFHWHAPQPAKYVNFGDNKRIDVGPGGLDELLDAYRAGDLSSVLFVLEGKMKHLSSESNGWHVVSVASVTLWDPAEVRWLGRWAARHIQGVPFYVGPDADWENLERNKGAVFRQAMYVQTHLRDEGVRTMILAPCGFFYDRECKCKPGKAQFDGLICIKCGGYLKGFDDYNAAGGTADYLWALDRREPWEHIFEFVYSLPIDPQRKNRTARALRGLSLHDRYDLLDVPLKTMQRIMRARKPHDVPQIIAELQPALHVDGSLEIVKREFYDEKKERWFPVWDWLRRPTIHVREPFSAKEEIGRLKEMRIS